ncbi:protein O-mannosyl-transferase TMTC2 [Lepeophtheirus salmonis]|uniref:protein O-mannosyl-transferase TMTC2 n=1 Tax=Lepeophtheirus salmonis TaxID=72036 RepID=UPI001AEA3971|nr:protein O-mannosyl-transferase TMTC2-like [Lepeophtheirus salmonis]
MYKKHSFLVIVPVFLSVIVYLNTLRAGFVYDDLKAILQNEDVHSDSPLSNVFLNDFWGVPLSHSGSHKSYRPFTTLSYRFNHLISGYSALYFHFTNVILYGLSVYLFSQLACKLTQSNELGLYAGSLFSVHPIHTEAVAGLVGRAEVLSGIFFLLSILCYLKEIRSLTLDENGNIIKASRGQVPWKTLLLTTVSMLSKENGITALGVCFLLEVVLKKRSSMQRQVFLVIGGGTLLFLRGWVMAFKPPSFSEADNPASSPSVDKLSKILTFSYLPSHNFLLLLCPNTLSFDWSMGSIPLLRHLSDPRNAVTLLFYSILIKLVFTSLHEVHQRKKCILFCSLGLMILPFTPASNIFFYVGFVVAERILFIPSMGYCLFLAYSIREGPDRIFSERKASSNRKLSHFIVAFIIVLGVFKTLHRNEDWIDEESLYKSGVSINPPKAFGNLANVLSRKGRNSEAEHAFKMALKHRPNMADVHYNLGVLYQNTQRFNEAIPCYENAIHYRPKLAQAYLNLGIIHSETGSKESAINIWKLAININDEELKDPETNLVAKISAHQNIGKVLLEEKKLQDALKILTRGLQLSPKRYPKQGLFNLMGEVYRALNQPEEAEKMFIKSIQVKPDHIPAHLTYGKLLAKNKTRMKEAEERFLLASKLAPSESSVALHYGLFLLDTDRSLEAGYQFQRAAKLSPSDFESVFNAAVAFRQAGKYTLAEKFYRQSVSIRPEDASAHMNLGAMLHYLEKYTEAEEHYLEALSLDPHNQSTKINLQRLHNIMKQKGIQPVSKKSVI